MTEARGVKLLNPKAEAIPAIIYDSLEQPDVSATLQKNLSDVQWLDCLTGHLNRHPDNIFIDEKGGVTLTDNDHSFYPGRTGVSDPDRKTDEGGSLWQEEPELIDQQTFNALQALSPEIISTHLSHLLDKPEIEATLDRLHSLKNHALKLEREKKVVGNRETWRSQDSKSVAQFLKTKEKP